MKKAIPQNVCELVGVAAKDAVRGALRGVQIILNDDHYLATASDGRILVRIRGEYLDTPDDVLGMVDTKSTVHVLRDVVIPTDVLKAIAKVKVQRVGSLQYDAMVVAIDKDQVQVARGDRSRVTVERASRAEEGRFPDADNVIPNLKKVEPAKGRTRINPKLLTQVLNTLAKLTDDLGVDIYTTQECGGFSDKEKKDPLGGIIVVTCKNVELKQEITAILMPLT